MSLVERARERVEEVKAKGAMAVVEERFPKIKEIRGGGGILGGGSSPELPTMREIREKGILTVLEEKLPRVKEIRERGILTRLRLPAKEEAKEVEKKEIVVEEGPAITGRAAVRETRLSVEV